MRPAPAKTDLRGNGQLAVVQDDSRRAIFVLAGILQRFDGQEMRVKIDVHDFSCLAIPAAWYVPINSIHYRGRPLPVVFLL